MQILLLLSQLAACSAFWFGPSEVIVANEEADAIPVTIPDTPMTVQQRTPVTVSGEWTSAGMTISPSNMIVHDLFFYVASDTSPPCSFSMNYVLNNIQSRTIKRFDLGTSTSAETHFQAGILASELRFGTIGSGTCVRHWMAVGYV